MEKYTHLKGNEDLFSVDFSTFEEVFEEFSDTKVSVRPGFDRNMSIAYVDSQFQRAHQGGTLLQHEHFDIKQRKL